MQDIDITNGPVYLVTVFKDSNQAERWTGPLDPFLLEAETIVERALVRRRRYFVQGIRWTPEPGLDCSPLQSGLPVYVQAKPQDFAADVSIASGTWVGKIPFQEAVMRALEHESFDLFWADCIAKWDGINLWALMLFLLQADLGRHVRPRRSFRLRLPWAGPLP